MAVKKNLYRPMAILIVSVMLLGFSCKAWAYAGQANVAEAAEPGEKSDGSEKTVHKTITLAAMELSYGNTKKIEYPQIFPENTSFTYASSNGTVAQVKNGIVIANDTGQAVISITASSGNEVWYFEQAVTVRLSSFVLKAYSSSLYQIDGPRIMLPADSMTVAEGKTAKLGAVVGRGCISQVTFRSSDKSIVKVSKNGTFCKITGVKEGKAVVTATYQVGHRTWKVNIDVTVAKPDIPVGNPKNAAKYKKSDQWEGDYAYFGRYEQDNILQNGSEMILWRVLEVTDDSILLLSDTSLSARLYHETFEDATWEKSDLRAWLNSEFKKRAFTGAEAAALVKNKVITKADSVYGNGTTVETEDYVYLLSSEEAMNPAYGFYPRLSATETRKSSISEYALANDGYANEAGRVCWWLRDNGVTEQFGAYVFTTGGITYDYFVGRRNDGVRPVIRLKLAKISFAASEEGYPVIVVD